MEKLGKEEEGEEQHLTRFPASPANLKASTRNRSDSGRGRGDTKAEPVSSALPSTRHLGKGQESFGIVHGQPGSCRQPQSPALPVQVDEGVAGGRAPVGGGSGHALIHEEPQGHMALRGDIGLETEAVPKLEALGEPLPAPVIWKADPKG